MKLTLILIVILASFFVVRSNAQSLAVNTDGSTASTSALLDVKSLSKGLLIPRMTKANKNAIVAPATGLLIFQTGPDSTGFHYYDGSIWIWLANSVTPNEWVLDGNNNVGPSSKLGSLNNEDVRFAANSSPRGVISAANGFWGFGMEYNPRYDLDVSLGPAGVFPCSRNGIRLKPNSLNNSACDNGLFIGLDNNNSYTDAMIWNYGNNSTGAQSIRMGLNYNEVMRLNSNGFMGMAEINPQYDIDMKLGYAAVNPCNRNGLRINTLTNTNACEKGLFLGLDDNANPLNTSLWNFGDGTYGNTMSLRFGLGNDFTYGEKMRITVWGIGIGTTAPVAKLQIRDDNGTVFPGVMVTSSSLSPGIYGFYMGLKDNSNNNVARVWNYQNADIEFGTNNNQRMIVTAAGNVGIANLLPPTSTLQVDGTVAVGVSRSVVGGTLATPVSLSSQKSYIGLSPAAGDHYLLPDPTTCTGRIYYIRNDDNGVSAWIGTAAGLLCPGNYTCLPSGTFYELKATISVKTIIAISDGLNWTVGRID